jgi:hypothetical protein
VTIPLFSHADATDRGMLKANRRHLDLFLLIVGISFVYVEETAPLGEGLISVVTLHTYRFVCYFLGTGHYFIVL